ncbi:uncharacterized protein [Henckelia pumila]|uniref:uncharacterized protein n=1 Tax=Henckelia pumila TaxID=405737 RepID=UPI003C6E7A1F
MTFASAYHQKIKFPVGNQVGEIRGEQPSSRRCYANTIRVDNKRARSEREENGPGKAEVCAVVEVKEEHEAVELLPEQSGKVAKIARDLESILSGQLRACLARNLDVFAWHPKELTGILAHVAEHKFNIIPGSRPVKQKKRHNGTEKDKVIADQFQELMEAGDIREVQFPTWISNVMLVPKATRKWRMCIDFRDLNEACPKDFYHFPRIDQLVDSTSGFELLCLMDAYQGYHQIPLAQEDQDKVSFITSGGTFCYVVMPFGLKNAGVTYQRMMDRVFQGQLGQNVEVYVDDILVKSWTREYFIPDLEETFGTLRKYGVKLNLTKCVFGVKSGKFLGFVVTERGIKVNPEKVLNFGQEEVWRVFVDGASSFEGSGVGVVLISPTQEKTRVALRLHPSKSNNEAVITGLKLPREAGAEHAIIYSDSQLVVQQVQGTFSVKEERLREYVELVKRQVGGFSSWSIEQIPREHNSKADTLAKMATSLTGSDSREVIQQTESVLVVEEGEKQTLEEYWMTPLLDYLRTETLPEEEILARKVKRQVPCFTLLNGNLYRRSFHCPLLRCMAEKKIWCASEASFRQWKAIPGIKKIDWCTEMKIKQAFTSVAYPQSNGQTEVTNRTIIRSLQARLYGVGKNWVDEIPGVLWAYRTTPKTATGEKSFSLVYGSEAILLVKIEQFSPRIQSYQKEGANGRDKNLI